MAEGRAALAGVDDARAAIIACYVAMERSLAERGTARAAADTPDELLARAVASGVVRGGAAGRLTALFYEARFSTHPLDGGQRDAASAALDELAAELAARPAQSAAAAGGHRAGAAARPGTGAGRRLGMSSTRTGPGAPAGGRWRAAVPELVIAAVTVAAAALAAAAVSGWPGAVTVAIATAVIALLVLRALIPRSAAQALRLKRDRQRARQIHGYAQRRFVVVTSLSSRAMYESDLRPALEHVLAARLAERHAVNLYTEPEKARQAFCRTRADASAVVLDRPGAGPRRGRASEPEARDFPPGPRPADHPIGAAVTPQETARQAKAVLDELGRAVVGRRRSLELVLIGILAGGHVLLEDLPGLGKTLIARSFAQVLGLDFARIQFTPDLLPSDVTGAPLYDQRNGEMVFRPGPVFTQLLLADEINRTPPKTQAALLEAMGEGQVSVDGESRAGCRSRSSCWRPTTRSSTRAPTSCPRRSSTAS